MTPRDLGTLHTVFLSRCPPLATQLCTAASSAPRNRDLSCFVSGAGPRVIFPSSRRCRATSRPASAFPIFACVHSFPVGETTRAPFLRQRDARGMFVDMVVTGPSGGSATAGMRTPSPEPAETPDAHCAFGEQSRATGLQMPRMSSTIPAPAITISEAAPAPAQKPAAQSSA
jgi:hypothetical protein